MKKNALFLLLSCGCASWFLMECSLLSAQTPVQITIDAASASKPVSPNIYGKNNCLSDNPASPLSLSQWQFLRDVGIKMFRESGGNNSTKYNWRKKLTSHPDWYNNVYKHDWDYAAGTLLANLPRATGMWTLPLIGKAAANTSNNFNDWSYNNSKWWEGVNQNLAGGGTANTAGGSKALKEGNPALYTQDWPPDSVVGILNKWFGTGGLGYDKNRLPYWSMDNEPEIWSGTHDDVMPVQMPADTFMQRWFATAKKARALFPGIKLVGPVPANEWQWYNWNGNWISYGGKNYVWLEFFIKRIADEQKASGVRLLDVLDIHFYPGETSTSDIVQLHRVWFDRNYVYPGNNGVHRIGGWDTGINKEYIFGRCQDWLTRYLGPDHGVTFAVTETDIKSSDPNIRAVWYASNLGEFARQGVEIFTPWGWAPGMYEVLHLFSRYNQEKYIPGTSTDEMNVSAYPTLNAAGDSLTVALVNRSQSTSKDIRLTINNFNLSEDSASYFRINSLPTAETFKSHTNNALKSGVVVPEGKEINLTLPPLSVTTLLLNSKSMTAAGKVKMPEAGVLEVFPNPASDWVTVSWPATWMPPFTLKMLTIKGQTVLTRRIAERVNGPVEWNFPGIPDGTYFIVLSSSSGRLASKILIDK